MASEKKNVIFDYDAMGNRIAKHIYNNQTAMLERSTYYILDAQGNQLSMYEHKVTDNAVVYYLADRNIYGSSRLGSLRDTVNMFIPTNLPSYGVVGNRNYELSNHLGNVLAVVNDIVYPISDDSTTILSYEVGLTQVSDYSPFGVQLDGRTVENRMYSIKQNCYDSIVVDTSYIANIDFQNGSNGFISENCMLSININIYTGERKLSLDKCNIPSPFPGFPSTTQDNKVYLNYTKEDNTTPKLPRDLAQLLVALGLQTYISVKKAHKNIIP